MDCKGCDHGIWDGRAPMVYCNHDCRYHGCDECCDACKERAVEPEKEEGDLVVTAHAISIHCMTLCENTALASEILKTIMEESPTLRRIVRKVDMRRVELLAEDDDKEDDE